MSEQPFYKGPALRVEQPLGTFFVISISADKLLEVCYSDKAEADKDGFGITGTQRKEDLKRQVEISQYIQSTEAAFPNSIILGANYSESGEYVESDKSWRIEESGNGSFCLEIPTAEKLASIIDGQHRLKSFRSVDSSERKSFELLCSVYVDLPIPYHAYLFSTINFNQKKVDRSLAYNLFGFDIDAADPDKWVPETLAVSLARRLNIEDTPFKGAIVLGVAGSVVSHEKIKISMATIVDGLLRLISKKPKKDRSLMMSYGRKERTRAALPDDQSPLRFLYKQGYDDVIYEVVLNFFTVVNEFFWENAPTGSYIYKTVGVQALFEVLDKMLVNFSDSLDGEIADFESKLMTAKEANLDFSDAQASGIGKTSIRMKLLEHIEVP